MAESDKAAPPPGLAGMPIPGLEGYATPNGSGPCEDCAEASPNVHMTMACMMLAGAVLLLAIAVARKGAVPNGA